MKIENIITEKEKKQLTWKERAEYWKNHWYYTSGLMLIVVIIGYILGKRNSFWGIIIMWLSLAGLTVIKKRFTDKKDNEFKKRRENERN